MKRARLIYNPTSGKERVKKQLPYILNRLERAGYEASAHQTCAPGDAKLAAKIACERGYDLVIAAGGDGTLFEVINGMAGEEHRPTLGIIPAGTTNDFARALGIPFNIRRACDVLCSGVQKPIDIGRVNDQYFINVAAAGIMTELTYEVPSKLKTIFGYSAYLMKGITKLTHIKPTPVHIDYEGGVYEGDVLLFLICNTKSIGGYNKIAVKSEVDDGLLDVIIIEKMTIPRLVRLGFKTLKKKHLKDAKMKYLQLEKFNITMKRDLPLNLDGEYGGKFPCEFESLKHHINLLIQSK